MWGAAAVFVSGSTLVLGVHLLRDTAEELLTGTTVLRLYEIQDADGSLKSFDFSDDTFKTTALTTEEAALTYRPRNNASQASGLWTATQTPVTAFTTGKRYLAQFVNSAAYPTVLPWVFQYGSEVPSVPAADPLIVGALLYNDVGGLVTGGTATVTLDELQADGTIKGFDFNDDAFKTGALTTPTLALTHRTGNNGTRLTGFWSAAQTPVSAFTGGNHYLLRFAHSQADPTVSAWMFQYGETGGVVMPRRWGGALNIWHRTSS